MDKWLIDALDYGITEQEFWNMTIGELNRAIASKQRAHKVAEQERASHNYILADLIGRSISRLYSSSGKMPEIYEAYPSLFDSKEVQRQKAERNAQLSALRFKQFAQFHNNKFNKDGGKEN